MRNILLSKSLEKIYFLVLADTGEKVSVDGLVNFWRENKYFKDDFVELKKYFEN